MIASATKSVVGAAWKKNWDETKQHFLDWWEGKGFVIGGAHAGASTPHAAVEDPGPPLSFEASRTDGKWRVNKQHFQLSRSDFPLDSLPVASFDLGRTSQASMSCSTPDTTSRSPRSAMIRSFGLASATDDASTPMLRRISLFAGEPISAAASSTPSRSESRRATAMRKTES